MIKESGLVALMKDAYKDGYDILAASAGERAHLTIKTPEWMVSARVRDIPRKALGLLVEHLGYMPTDEAVRACKGEEPQSIIRGVMEDEVAALMARITDAPAMPCHRVPLIYRGQIVLWQQTDGRIVGLPGYRMRMVVSGVKAVQTIHGRCLSVWRGDAGELVAVECGPVADNPLLAHLELVSWAEV